MMKNLRQLMKLRAWLKSDTLKAGGVVGMLGAAEVFLRGADGMGVLAWGANVIGMTAATTNGLVLGAIGLVMLILRAKTERSLVDKSQDGFSHVGLMAGLFALGIILTLAIPQLAHAEIKSVSWTVPTAYNNGDFLPGADLDNYELGCGPVTGDRATLVRTWLAPGTPPRAEDFPPGTYFCALRVTTTAGAASPLATSDWSTEVAFVVAVLPNPPTGLTVN